MENTVFDLTVVSLLQDDVKEFLRDSELLSCSVKGRIVSEGERTVRPISWQSGAPLKNEVRPVFVEKRLTGWDPQTSGEVLQVFPFSFIHEAVH